MAKRVRHTMELHDFLTGENTEGRGPPEDAESVFCLVDTLATLHAVAYGRMSSTEFATEDVKLRTAQGAAEIFHGLLDRIEAGLRRIQDYEVLTGMEVMDQELRDLDWPSNEDTDPDPG